MTQAAVSILACEAPCKSYHNGSPVTDEQQLNQLNIMMINKSVFCTSSVGTPVQTFRFTNTFQLSLVFASGHLINVLQGVHEHIQNAYLQ